MAGRRMGSAPSRRSWALPGDPLATAVAEAETSLARAWRWLERRQAFMPQVPGQW
jgi:hypothetical protein